uniref:Uncharacterized protein n=1 Tax=Aegilops tauschii TaxID=37682 RepID=N1QYD0_AEGTA
MQPAQPPCGSRRGGGGGPARAATLPRCNHHRLLVLVVIVYLLGGSDVLLLAAAAPVRRLGAEASVAYDVGSRPVPEVVAAAGSPSSTPSAVRFADDKRPVPSCPDALHNSKKFEIGSQQLYMVPLIRFSVVNMGLSEHVSVFSQEILESRRDSRGL